jgi:predicted AlkP superfamily pyrophosphatase or phosphodiesterase
MIRRLVLFAVSLSISLVAQPPTAPLSSRPKLVLLVAIDQFRYDYFPRFRSEYTGGLKLLLDRGANFVDAHLEHYPTVTAIGHSTMLTGATPAISGIVGNDWFDRATGKQVTSVEDSSVQLIGAATGTGASPRRLVVSTIGDEMKRAGWDRPKVIGMAMKDRSAILPSGHMADGAYWYDSNTGGFLSSTYYFSKLPQWVSEFNGARYGDAYADKPWQSAAEGRLERRLPREAGKSLYTAINNSPFGNDVLELFAERAIEAEKLGQRGTTDLLTISFSSNDSVGHAYGPDSPEVRNISIAVDRTLGRLFGFLDKRIGLNNVIVVMTADHGVAPVPELLMEQKMPGGRISPGPAPRSFFDPIQQALEKQFGPGNWISNTAGTSPYFNYELIAEKKLNPIDVQRVAAEAIAAAPHVARVYTRERLLASRGSADRIDSRVLRGFNASRSGDLEILLEPYWIRGTTKATHGTPFNYDSHIPLVFMGPGIRSGRYYQSAALNDAAPTLAAMLDIEIPSGSVGRVLHEMFQPAGVVAPIR